MDAFEHGKMVDAIKRRNNMKISEYWKYPITINVPIQISKEEFSIWVPGIENFEKAKKVSRKRMQELLMKFVTWKKDGK